MTTKPTSLRPGATPTLGMPAPPPLPAEVETLARGLRLPHLRRAAPEVLATARAQRWEPAEALKALLAAGRARPSRATRRAAAGFPTGKTAVTRILRADLVVVDDIGLLPEGPDAAASHHRQGGGATDLPGGALMAAGGERSWPSPGSFHDRPCGETNGP
jgi:hypothetical protein